MFTSKLKAWAKCMTGRMIFTLIKLRKKRDSVIIYAGPGIGDALYSLAYLEEFKKQNAQKKIIILTPPNLTSMVATFRGYDRIVAVKSAAVRKMLWQIWNSDAHLSQRGKDIGLLCHLAFINEYPQVHVMTRLWRDIYCVREGAPISYHNLAPQKVTCISDFYNRYDKIVVMNPYSNSSHLTEVALKHCARLAEYIKQRGGGSLYECCCGSEADSRDKRIALRTGRTFGNSKAHSPDCVGA